ncbi:MAG: type III secretion system chaperone [Chlamydiia bacterium]|nr:type III secretion system chaperone [Chlamydiia bacterium]
MKLEDVVDCLAKRAKSREVCLDAHGCCHFCVNENLDLWLESTLRPDEFMLYAPVCDVPQQREADLLRTAMEANLFQKDTGKGVLGFSPDERVILLSQRFYEPTLDEAAFFDELRSFVTYLKYWMQRLEDSSFAFSQVSDLSRHLRGLKSEAINVYLG